MDELLKRLEIQIKELIEQHGSLKHANQQLHQGKHALTREKELLLARQQNAIMQIQQLVLKLKSLEKTS